MVAMEDTPFSSPSGTPFSSSSDTLSWKTTPPSSPDDNYDTPTRKPPIGAPVSPTPSLYLPSRLKAEEAPDLDDLSASPMDGTGCLAGPSTISGGESSKQSGQKHKYDNTATRHPIHAWRHAAPRSISLERLDSDLSRVGTGQDGKSSSQISSALGEGNQERCIGSELGNTSSSTSATPDTGPSQSGSSSNEPDDTRGSSSSVFSIAQGHGTEPFMFEYDPSNIWFETPCKKNGAGVSLPTTQGGDGTRGDTLGADPTRRVNTQGRPHSQVRNSLPSAILDSSEAHAVENVGRSLADRTQPENYSIQSKSSHRSRHSMDLRPGINFLNEHEPHHATSMDSTEDHPSEEQMQQFSFTRGSLTSILTPEMGQLLCEKKNKCVARTQQDRRCSRNHRGSHKVSGLLRHFVSVNTSDAIFCIQNLVSSVLCTQHMGLVFENWKCWITLHQMVGDASNRIEDPRLSLLADWIVELQVGVKLLIPLLGAGIKSEDDQVDAPSKPRATIQQLIPWCSGDQKSKSINQKLREICISTLSPKQGPKSGFIYIYWSRDVFGRMKIGCTENINKRLQEWEKGCEKDLLLHFPKEAEKGDIIPHIFRVERLIHAELRDYRRKEPRCRECNKGHIEWFEGVSVNVAMDVAKKWIDWMRRKPYEKRDFEGKVEWVLSDEALDSLKTVCKPHEKLESGVCLTKR
ncbi:meiotically up-regulated gene 113-domain-containing protein [Aspergillus floccosus]